MFEDIGPWLASFSKPPDWVGWLAAAISAGTILVTVWKFGQRAVFWIDWFLVKPLVFHLRKEKIAFRIMIARIAGDEKPGRNRTLAQHLRKVSDNLIAVPCPFQLDLKLVGRDFGSELERADRIGRRWLTWYQADLLVWGYTNSEMDPVRLRFVPASAPATDRAFNLKEVLKGKFSSATAEALHLQALAALDPSGQLRAATGDEPRSSPAEERRQLLGQAADKCARLLEDPRGLTGQQRAELAVALAEAWFTIVDETGDVRLPRRAMPYLERALEDTAGIAPATAARLHLLLARALLGVRADRVGETIGPRAAERAIEIIDAEMRYGDRSSNRPDDAEWRCWRAAYLRLLGRQDEAILEFDTALEGVAPTDDPELWGRLTSLRGMCVGGAERWSLAALDRYIGCLTEALETLDAIKTSKDADVVAGGTQIAAAHLGHARVESMTERARRTGDVSMLRDAIADAERLFARFSERRWRGLAVDLRLQMVASNLVLGHLLLSSGAEDASEQRSRARDRWRRAREVAADQRRAIDPVVNPGAWIAATTYEAEAAEEMGALDDDPTSLDWALQRYDEAMVAASRLGHQEVGARIGIRIIRAIREMHRLEHARSRASGRDDGLLVKALELAEAVQAARPRRHFPREWADVEYERGRIYVRRAEFAQDPTAEFAAARSAFSAAAGASVEGDDPAGERVCEWWLKKAEQDEQLFRAAEASPPPALPSSAESGSATAHPLTAPISMPRRI